MLRPAPSGSPTGAPMTANPAPARHGREWHTSASRPQAGPGRGRSAQDRPTRRLRARADRAGTGGVALPQQARVLVRRHCRRAAGARYHRRGSWADVVDVSDRLLASEANNAARNAVRGWARGAELAPTIAASARAWFATWSSARAGLRGSFKPGWSPRRRDPTPAGRPAHRDRAAQRRHRRSDRRARRRAPVRANRRARAQGLAHRLPADEHRDGRAPVRDRRRAGGAERARAVLDLYCGIGRSGSRSPAAQARSGALRACRRRSPTPSTTPRRTGSPTPASSPPTRGLGIRPLLERAGRPHLAVVDPPRAGLSAKIVAGCSSARRRGSSPSPATRRRWRRTPPRWSRPDIRCGG